MRENLNGKKCAFIMLGHHDEVAQENAQCRQVELSESFENERLLTQQN